MKVPNSGFTLVELIVVITILAILAMIGFVSFSSYLAGTRDINRIASLNSISDGLELYRTRNKLPEPDDNVDVKVNGSTIAIQGYIGSNVLQTIEYNKTGKDPKDKLHYSYYLSRDNRYYQLMTYLEEKENLEVGNDLKITMIGEPLSAIDYSNRYPKLYGNKLGILTNSELTPIQELAGIKLSGELDLHSTQSGIFQAHFTDDISIIDTGANLDILKNVVSDGGKWWNVDGNNVVKNPGDGGATSPGLPSKTVSDCGTIVGEIIYGTPDGSDMGLTCSDDIIVCNGTPLNGLTITACNEGSNKVSTAYNDTGAYGELFQWGNNAGIKTAVGSSTLISISATGSTFSSPIFINFTANDWNQTPNNNLWGNTPGGNIDRKGPCKTGYHVPNHPEWVDMFNILGTSQTSFSITDQLKIPAAGYRNWTDNLVRDFNTGFYWSSTPYGGNALRLDITTNSIYTFYGSDNRARGSSVRCFKN